MKFAFIVDPLDKLKAYKDSSVFMMREAAKRGHEVHAFEAKHMAMLSGNVTALASKISVNADNHDWYKVEGSTETRLADFDAVLMRKDPPFNQEYLYSTLLLELAEKQGARIVNRARSLRDYNEKLGTAKFPQFTPPTLVTQSMERVHHFIDEHKDVIVKKLDGMGGTSIFRVRA
ncbi:MAG: glutathione synthase, partial [Betaproteobacteria bacterium]